MRFDKLKPNSHSLRAGLENIAILMGLFLEDGETRGAEISLSLYARAMGWRNPDGLGGRRARRHFHEFEEREILRHAGELQPIKGRSKGTSLWEPYDFHLADVYDGWITET